jgi:hypothetical protein
MRERRFVEMRLSLSFKFNAPILKCWIEAPTDYKAPFNFTPNCLSSLNITNKFKIKGDENNIHYRQNIDYENTLFFIL